MSQWDENYLRWRERQIAMLDAEYDEYCRDCESRFDQDFQSWRGSRQGQGSGPGQFGPGRDNPRQSMTERSESDAGSASAGATTTVGGQASATSSSTGSTGRDSDATAIREGRSAGELIEPGFLHKHEGE